ncbi:ABC transporter permease [Lacrimispora sp. 210928-DFI.3.58]|uniref:ABC transporter permease n=1 Tax=Lacrimispora sp. 210928-DFI.3.58 TaxID=2883214 RepID=UPI0015B5C4AF|nr:ABC transporter permease [Lacrimispora sp. 210928-DFI.3.58]
MLRYFRKRLLLMIPVMFGVALLIFTMLYLTPGDPARMIVGEMATEEEYQAQREEMGLNDPYIVQFGNYLGGILHGDFGKSYITGQSVTESLLSRYPTTMLLSALSITVAVIIAIPWGSYQLCIRIP